MYNLENYYNSDKFAQSWLISCASSEHSLKELESFLQQYLLSDANLPLENNPDYYLLNPENSTGAKEGFSIDDIRFISKFLSTSPGNSLSKVAVIYDAHLLNTKSQNAILKLIEEPQKNRYIFLLCNSLYSFLPTILSRCQKINILSNQADIKHNSEIENIFTDSSFEKQMQLVNKLGKEDGRELWEDLTCYVLDRLHLAYSYKLGLEVSNDPVASIFAQADSSLLSSKYQALQKIITLSKNKDLDRRQSAVMILDELNQLLDS